MPRPSRPAPARLVDGWPDRPSELPEVETARQFALNLRRALDGLSLRAAKARTGVDHTTISDILNGTAWPDLHTIARLEAGLGADLYPHGIARSHPSGTPDGSP